MFPFVRITIKMICAKFERKILISYAGTFGSKVTLIGVKEEKINFSFLDKKLDLVSF